MNSGTEKANPCASVIDDLKARLSQIDVEALKQRTTEPSCGIHPAAMPNPKQHPPVKAIGGGAVIKRNPEEHRRYLAFGTPDGRKWLKRLFVEFA